MGYFKIEGLRLLRLATRRALEIPLQLTDHFSLQIEDTMASILEKPCSPRWVCDDSGEVIEVILGYDDFKTLLQKIARETDWETLPIHLQDAVDALLMEEANEENGERSLCEMFFVRPENHLSSGAGCLFAFSGRTRPPSPARSHSSTHKPAPSPLGVRTASFGSREASWPPKFVAYSSERLSHSLRN